MTMQFWTLAFICSSALFSGAIGAYYGKRVDALTENGHDVRGTVYLVDSTRIRIVGFNYDGTAPATLFYMGFVGDSMVTNVVSEHGTPTVGPRGETVTLGAYSEQDVTITIPTGKSIGNALWLSVWCSSAKADFGNVTFPDSVKNDPPAPLDIGMFTTHAHQVSSGVVTILDSRTIKINTLNYDGTGPAAWFIVGKTPSPPIANPASDIDYIDDATTPKLPNEAGSTEKLPRYTQQTITLKLPADEDIADNGWRWLSIYCITASQNFGEVMIPANPNIIPYLDTSSTTLANCEEMNDDFQVAWEIMGNNIAFEFAGRLDADQYMAFGLSGSNTASSMDDADVVVAYYSGNEAKADDYDLNQRSQCSLGVGACPDSQVTGATNSVTGVSGSKVDDITRVKFTRALNTGDTTGDKIYMASGNQYVVWALGRLNPSNIATKHQIAGPSRQLNFGRTGANNCNPLMRRTQPQPKPKPWVIPQIRDETEFRITIGPAGGDQGYTGITKANSWGIAFYVNGILIPEIVVEKGKNYTFKIQTGDNTNNQAAYHPVYITSDSIGGYAQRSDEDKQKMRVYAGLHETTKMPLSNAVGPLCEYQQPPSKNPDNYQTFNAYKNELTLNPANCDTSNNYNEFTWTVPDDAEFPIYYQCYTHQWLGWRITTDSSALVLPSIMTMIAALCLSLFFK